MIYTYKRFSKQVDELEISHFICSSSFEKRCSIIPSFISKLQIENSFIFCNTNEVESIIDNAKILKSELPKSQIVDLNSNEPVYNYIQIMDIIDSIKNSSSTKNILIDTTTFTHETLLVLLRLLEINLEFLGDIHMSYLGAKEYSTNKKVDENKWLSKGVDEIRTIIGYPGFTDPTKENHLMILFGFEFDRTMKLIEEYEFDVISIGLGNQLGEENNHTKINKARHQKLVQMNPEAREFSFSVSDPYEVRKQVLDYIKENSFSDYNTVIAPMNNKVSTIGVGLAAMENENLQLAYAKASLYNTDGYSKPGKKIYLEEITFN